MNIPYFIVQAAAPAIGGVITVTFAWYLVRNDIRKYLSVKSVEAGKGERNDLFSLRLQAHERLIVFVDRLNPANLFVRLSQPGISARVLQSLILNEIRAEYQHNVSQQLYISSISWKVLCKLKEDTIAMINNAAAGLPPDASGTVLSKKVLEHLSGIAENPYELTLELIKNDIHQLF